MRRPLARFFAVLLVAAFCVVGSVRPAKAAVSFTGDVRFGSNGFTLSIGNDLPGAYSVDGGSEDLFEGSIAVGNNSFGTLTVSDPGSVFQAGRMEIGVGAVGNTFVEAGGALLLTNDLSIGGSPFSEGSLGSLTVTGRGSVVTSPAFFGSPSRIEIGSGSLHVLDEGIVDLPSTELIVGINGEVLLADGLVSLESIDNGGVLSGTGEFTNPGFTTRGISNSGRIEVAAAQTLSFSRLGDATNTGDIVIHGGEINFDTELENQGFNPQMRGQIDLRDGVLRTVGGFGSSALEPGLDNFGTLSSTGGLNDVFGPVRNNFGGDISITNSSTTIFHDEVINDGTISIMPGSTAVFLNGLISQQGSTLLANVAGTNDDTGFGVAEVVGAATLSGSLEIGSITGVEPTLGDEFALLSASGGVSGDLLLTQAPSPGEGLAWDLAVEANQVVLSVVAAGSPGDFNGDGLVNAADYTVWRDNLNATDESAINFAGDGFSGVDVGDYLIWRENFGAAASAAVTAPVPEPASLYCLLAGSLIVCCSRRRV
ncbi:MAG: hypothetical protein AAGF31_05685 [Planctomycetota bacterium]